MEKLNHRVEDWLYARAEAKGTQYSYLRYIKTFSKFCQRKGKNLYGIVEEHRAAQRKGIDAVLDFTESWQDLIRAYSTKIKKSDYAPLTQKNYLSIAKSFLSYYRIPVRVDLPKRAHVVFHNRDLTKEIIRKILNKASQRDRTIWLLMAESGLRAKTAIHLRYWQIKEDFEKGTVPMRILTPAESLKDHVGDRWSFIGEDGCKALREYLQTRMPLKDDEYLFTTKKPERMKGEQFTGASLSAIWRKKVKELKLEDPIQYRERIHYKMRGLRKYFRNNMRADPSYREFWMGHSLGVDEHYVNRDPEFHRKLYKKGYEHLRILEPATPSQLIEIADQLKQKDQEIQELKTLNQQILSKFEKLDELLKALKVLEEQDFSDMKPGTIESTVRRDPLEIIADKLQKLKKQTKKRE